MNLDILMAQLAAVRNQVDTLMLMVSEEREKFGINTLATDAEGNCLHPVKRADGSEGRSDCSTMTRDQFFCKSCGEIIVVNDSDVPAEAQDGAGSAV